MTRRSQPLKRGAARRSQKPEDRASKRSGTWQLQEARAKLSDVVNAAARGPQHITRNGKSVAVVLSPAEYGRLTKPRLNLLEFFQQSPLAAVMAEREVEFERDQGPLRDVDL
jgi:prevent-host-death family protein